MTREKVKKELIPMLQAYVDGAIIQVMDLNDEWQDIKNPEFNGNIWEYRIKPGPKYRPFKSKEECWSEMLKHEPFGWVTDGNDNYNIRTINNSLVMLGNEYHDYTPAFEDLKFIDGQPFGIKIDE